MAPYGAIFDCDGVIALNGHLHVNAWREFAKIHRSDLTEQNLIDNVYGRTNSIALKYLFGGLSAQEFTQYASEKEALFRKQLSSETVKPINGLIDLLDQLKQNDIPMAIATTANELNVLETLKYIPVKDYFKAIVWSPVEGGDPERYTKAANGLNMDYTSCIVFEDSPSGAQLAKQSGMKVVGVLTTRDSLDNVDLSIKDFTELDLKRLEQLIQQT